MSGRDHFRCPSVSAKSLLCERGSEVGRMATIVYYSSVSELVLSQLSGSVDPC